MSATQALTLAGETVILDADRALVWDRRLLISDVHLDKAATFQRAGMAVPLGDEDLDLARIARLVERHDAREVLILGDLVHAPPRRGGATERRLTAWIAERPELAMTVVVGNHDRDAMERLAHWPVRWIEDALDLGPFTLRHAPAATRRQQDPFEIAGHLHPVVRLRDGRRDALRLPVFWERHWSLVLPAFGSFTGGHAVDPAPQDRLHAVHPTGIVTLPAR